MSKGISKNILLPLAGVTVIVLSIYLTRSRRAGAPAEAEVDVAAAAVDDTAAAGQAAGDAGRPLVSGVRSVVHGVMGDLERVQKRVAGERDLLVASVKTGRSGRHLVGPAGQEPPAN